jgi:hypothetical protein
MSCKRHRTRITLLGTLLALVIGLAGPLASASFAASPADTKARVNDSYGCLIGATGAAFITVAVLAIDGPAFIAIAGATAMTPATIASFIGGGMAAGCVLGAAAAPGSIVLWTTAETELTPKSKYWWVPRWM